MPSLLNDFHRIEITAIGTPETLPFENQEHPAIRLILSAVRIHRPVPNDEVNGHDRTMGSVANLRTKWGIPEKFKWRHRVLPKNVRTFPLTSRLIASWNLFRVQETGSRPQLKSPFWGLLSPQTSARKLPPGASISVVICCAEIHMFHDYTLTSLFVHADAQPRPRAALRGISKNRYPRQYRRGASGQNESWIRDQEGTGQEVRERSSKKWLPSARKSVRARGLRSPQNLPDGSFPD